MLKNFFKLDTPFTKYDEADLERHFTTSCQIQDVLFEPQSWPVSLHKLKGVTFNNVSLSKTAFSRVTFTKCTFTDCLLIGCDFEDVEFHQCKFIDCNFYKSEFRNSYIDPLSIELHESYKANFANVGVGLFQRILDNSSGQHQADFAMHADILFIQWKRAQLKHDAAEGKISKLEARWRGGKNFIFDKLAGYGYRPVRFFCWTIAFFLLVSFINHITLSNSLISSVTERPVESLVDSVFYTFSMLTVLGFSTITPVTPVAKIATVLEALLAVGWLGIFTSILVKRFIR